jgi:hypothetical protein
VGLRLDGGVGRGLMGLGIRFSGRGGFLLRAVAIMYVLCVFVQARAMNSIQKKKHNLPG